MKRYLALLSICLVGCESLDKAIKNIELPSPKTNVVVIATNYIPIYVTNIVTNVVNESSVTNLVVEATNSLDYISVKGLRPYGDDKITTKLRSVIVRGDTIHLDFDKPDFPAREEDINITWVAIKIESGKATKMGRFEHGRPRNDTREAATLIGDRPGFTINRGDTIAVMGVAYQSSSRPKLRTNNVLVQWK